MSFCAKCGKKLDGDMEFCTSCDAPVAGAEVVKAAPPPTQPTYAAGAGGSIFDKVLGGLNKGVATVGANSKAMVEKARIKTIISNLESERRQLTELLGAKVYEKCIESGETIVDENMANLIAEIGKRLDGIAEQQAAIKRIDEEVSMVTGSGKAAVCQCGHFNLPHAKFCEKCGNMLQQSSGAPGAGEAVVCQCGGLNPPHAKFCEKCGSAL